MPEDVEAGQKAFHLYCCWQKDSVPDSLLSSYSLEGWLILIRHLLAFLFFFITCQQRDDCSDFLAVLFFFPTQEKPNSYP